MFKRLFVFVLTLFFLVPQAGAVESDIHPAPKKIHTHGNGFGLSRKVAVTGKKSDPMSVIALSDMLREKGAAITSGLGQKGRVVLRKVGHIDTAPGRDALRITVTPKRVNIDYTTQASLERAIEILGAMIGERNGKYVIEGVDITDWDAGAARNEGIIDASTRMQPVATLQNQIKHSGAAKRHEEVYVRFVDSGHWRAGNKTFELINPGAKIYPADGHYSGGQVHELLSFARRERIDLVPVVELLAPNRPFEEFTGHSLFSVEGMRFVRALLEEYAEEWKCKKICLGARSPEADDRYLEFILEIAGRAGMECIILD